MAQSLQDSVVVITGASSGIGRATALEFARHGATLVLASRSKRHLAEAAEECEDHGAADVLTVVTDVSDEGDVSSLARKAIKEFGRIDVWVNNAGVGLYGRIDEAPLRSFRELIDINFFGAVHGTREAVKQFRQQGNGTLINVASQIALGGAIFNSAYASSKYAVRGLSDSVRQELLEEGIDVCTIYPAAIDTPFFENAANYTGRAVKPPGSIHDPEEVARAIVECAQSPKADVYVGKMGYVTEPLHWLAPKSQARVMSKLVKKEHYKDEPSGNTDGNLFRPSPVEAVHGGWKDSKRSGKATGITLGTAAAAAGIVWLLRRRSNEPRELDRAA